MNNSEKAYFERGLVFSGVVLVSIGMYLPWVAVKPSHEGPVNSIGLPGMETGVTGLDAGLLLIGLLALVLVVHGNLSQRSSLFVLVTGLFYLFVPLFHALVILSPPFTSNVGAFVTGFGGIVILVAGSIHLLSTVSDGQLTREGGSETKT